MTVAEAYELAMAREPEREDLRAAYAAWVESQRPPAPPALTPVPGSSPTWAPAAAPGGSACPTITRPCPRSGTRPGQPHQAGSSGELPGLELHDEKKARQCGLS